MTVSGGQQGNSAIPTRVSMQVKQEVTEPDMEQWTGSKLGKEYVKAVYCHPAYLTYMQSASCKIPAGGITRGNEVCLESGISNLR